MKKRRVDSIAIHQIFPTTSQAKKINTQHAPFAFLFRCGAKSTGNILAFIFGLVNLEYKSGNPSQTMLRRRDAFRSVSQAFHVYQKKFNTAHIAWRWWRRKKKDKKHIFGALKFFSFSLSHFGFIPTTELNLDTTASYWSLPNDNFLVQFNFFFVCALSQYSAFVWSAQAHLGTLWVDRS